MRITIANVFYNGQPVYREWTKDRNEVNFFSRLTVKAGKGQGVTFKHLVPLLNVKVPLRLPEEQRMAKVAQAQQQLLKLPGVTQAF